MSPLAAATAMVGLVAALNLILTVGLVRRMREHSFRLARLTTPFGNGLPSIIRPGARPGPFASTTVDGIAVDRSGFTLIAFFTPNCQPCLEETPAFLAHAAAMPGGRDRVLAVIVAAHRDTEAYAERFHDVARVVIEPDHGPIATAFAVEAFPAMVELDGDGMVTATAHRVRDLPARVAA